MPQNETIDILRDLPPNYGGIAETEELAKIENADLNAVAAELSTAFDRTFYLTADETALAAYEQELGIVPASTESLEMRRARLMSLRTNRARYTLPSLRSMLDQVLGADAYTLTLDYEEYTLELADSGVHDAWVEETLRRVCPVQIHWIHNTFPPRRFYGFYGASFWDWGFYG